MIEREEIDQKRIASSLEMARELGFERNLEEAKTASVRTYEKLLGEFALPKAGQIVEIPKVATLTIMDWGKNGAKHEDILFGVRMGKPSSSWERRVSVTELLGEIDLPRGIEGHLTKEALRNGGYEKLFKVLKELYKTEFWKDMGANMEKELLFGQSLIDDLIIPETRKVFPEFVTISDSFVENRKIFFVAGPETGKKTRRAMWCWVANYAMEFTYGRVQWKEENEGKLEFYKNTAYTVAPRLEKMDKGGVHSGWHFKSYDLESAKNELSEALSALNLKSGYGVK